jgi:Lrp/AsnC family transcriptional regulator, leucine-responsive regulatory protein
MNNISNLDIDTVDRAILRELQIDGRMTNAELSERVHLSASACFRRVKIMEEKGVIENYTAIVDQAACGRGQNVLVQVTLRSQESHDLEAFEELIARHPQVMECYLMSGDADYHLRVIVADTSDYEKLHRDVLTKLPGVDRIKSSFALRTVRKTTALPLED